MFLYLFPGGVYRAAVDRVVDSLLAGFAFPSPIDIPTYVESEELFNHIGCRFSVISRIAVPVFGFYFVIVDEGIENHDPEVPVFVGIG